MSEEKYWCNIVKIALSLQARHLKAKTGEGISVFLT